MPKTEKQPAEPKLWKDYLNRESVSKIASEIGRIHKPFDQPAFVDAVITDGFFELELKQRIESIADALKDYLPSNFSKSTGIFKKAAPKLGGFENWALMTYIERFGLEHLEQSIAAMKALTQHCTAEFAIRPFIIRYPDRMLNVMNEWTVNPNEHIRRLAAEGSRPRGVWTLHIEAFKKNPRPVLKILEKLKADPSLYVRKAVANNLNDISKEHPDLVIKTALKWKKQGNDLTDWIVKHACRSLIKKGDPRVFPIFGFTASPKLDVKALSLSKKRIKIGGELVLKAELKSLSKKSQKLAIDYKVIYVKKGGKTSPKVFKLTEKELSPGNKLSLSIKHSFQDRSTRLHHPGKHRLELVINGKSFGSLEFHLTR
jgi:3-methyladenine DNA glycosylase AlkC